MAKAAITEQYLTDIADAIRSKTGLSNVSYYPSEMASAIMTISGGGGITPAGTISIIENGTYNVSQYVGADVNVPTGGEVNNQTKTVSPTESIQNITYDSGYTGLSTVTINAIPSTYVGSGITVDPTPTVSGATVTIPSGYYSSSTSKTVSSGTAGTPTATKGTVSNHSVSVTPSVTNTTGYITGGTKTGTAVSVSASQLVSGTKAISSNGTGIDVTNYASVDVSVPTGSTINNQTKTVNPSQSQQTITYDSGYTGLSTVTVNAISSSYVGSGITRRTSSNLTVSGATVTAPAGYYENPASTSVASMSLPTSTSSSATSGYTSKATINRSTSDQYINIPPGYNSSGGYYKVSAVANGSVTAPSSISGTSATVTTGTNTLTLTKTVSVTPNVTTAGYVSTGTAGNSSISLTASVTTKAASTVTPGTSNQTISANQYLTGVQTILGDSDLIAANIKTGVQIFNTTGSYTSDANAAAGDIVSGQTAYVNGSKITGSLVVQNYYTGSSTPASSLGSNGDLYLQT